ncbi:hypothetical protein H696_01425 [Fonticula alba]|uniref:Exocyst complex component Sec8 n=1 Tax=Fonticula alba TaxID=691883 RepID=A0A058ZDL7_FONAL|nr:hypothetical protein H696_01425 [Fonticula alba]KCV72018.1 hypothetical protein H696_01425 [Fonticula alba]|eukprot:XP_009493596.1 hypothetical protein H696_01425 [Fonticula alba]
MPRVDEILALLDPVATSVVEYAVGVRDGTHMVPAVEDFPLSGRPRPGAGTEGARENLPPGPAGVAALQQVLGALEDAFAGLDAAVGALVDGGGGGGGGGGARPTPAPIARPPAPGAEPGPLFQDISTGQPHPLPLDLTSAPAQVVIEQAMAAPGGPVGGPAPGPDRPPGPVSAGVSLRRGFLLGLVGLLAGTDVFAGLAPAAGRLMRLLLGQVPGLEADRLGLDAVCHLLDRVSLAGCAGAGPGGGAMFAQRLARACVRELRSAECSPKMDRFGARCALALRALAVCLSHLAGRTPEADALRVLGEASRCLARVFQRSFDRGARDWEQVNAARTRHERQLADRPAASATGAPSAYCVAQAGAGAGAGAGPGPAAPATHCPKRAFLLFQLFHASVPVAVACLSLAVGLAEGDPQGLGAAGAPVTGLAIGTGLLHAGALSRPAACRAFAELRIDWAFKPTPFEGPAHLAKRHAGALLSRLAAGTLLLLPAGVAPWAADAALPPGPLSPGPGSGIERGLPAAGILPTGLAADCPAVSGPGGGRLPPPLPGLGALLHAAGRTGLLAGGEILTAVALLECRRVRFDRLDAGVAGMQHPEMPPPPASSGPPSPGAEDFDFEALLQADKAEHLCYDVFDPYDRGVPSLDFEPDFGGPEDALQVVDFSFDPENEPDRPAEGDPAWPREGRSVADTLATLGMAPSELLEQHTASRARAPPQVHPLGVGLWALLGSLPLAWPLDAGRPCEQACCPATAPAVLPCLPTPLHSSQRLLLLVPAAFALLDSPVAQANVYGRTLLEFASAGCLAACRSGRPTPRPPGLPFVQPALARASATGSPFTITRESRLVSEYLRLSATASEGPDAGGPHRLAHFHQQLLGPLCESIISLASFGSPSYAFSAAAWDLGLVRVLGLAEGPARRRALLDLAARCPFPTSKGALLLLYKDFDRLSLSSSLATDRAFGAGSFDALAGVVDSLVRDKINPPKQPRAGGPDPAQPLSVRALLDNRDVLSALLAILQFGLRSGLYGSDSESANRPAVIRHKVLDPLRDLVDRVRRDHDMYSRLARSSAAPSSGVNLDPQGSASANGSNGGATADGAGAPASSSSSSSAFASASMAALQPFSPISDALTSSVRRLQFGRRGRAGPPTPTAPTPTAGRPAYNGDDSSDDEAGGGAGSGAYGRHGGRGDDGGAGASGGSSYLPSGRSHYTHSQKVIRDFYQPLYAGNTEYDALQVSLAILYHSETHRLRNDHCDVEVMPIFRSEAIPHHLVHASQSTSLLTNLLDSTCKALDEIITRNHVSITDVLVTFGQITDGVRLAETQLEIILRNLRGIKHEQAQFRFHREALEALLFDKLRHDTALSISEKMRIIQRTPAYIQRLMDARQIVAAADVLHIALNQTSSDEFSELTALQKLHSSLGVLSSDLFNTILEELMGILFLTDRTTSEEAMQFFAECATREAALLDAEVATTSALASFMSTSSAARAMAGSAAGSPAGSAPSSPGVDAEFRTSLLLRTNSIMAPGGGAGGPRGGRNVAALYSASHGLTAGGRDTDRRRPIGRAEFDTGPPMRNAAHLTDDVEKRHSRQFASVLKMLNQQRADGGPDAPRGAVLPSAGAGPAPAPADEEEDIDAILFGECAVIDLAPSVHDASVAAIEASARQLLSEYQATPDTSQATNSAAFRQLGRAHDPAATEFDWWISCPLRARIRSLIKSSAKLGLLDYLVEKLNQSLEKNVFQMMEHAIQLADQKCLSGLCHELHLYISHEIRCAAVEFGLIPVGSAPPKSHMDMYQTISSNAHARFPPIEPIWIAIDRELRVFMDDYLSIRSIDTSSTLAATMASLSEMSKTITQNISDSGGIFGFKRPQTVAKKPGASVDSINAQGRGLLKLANSRASLAVTDHLRAHSTSSHGLLHTLGPDAESGTSAGQTGVTGHRLLAMPNACLTIVVTGPIRSFTDVCFRRCKASLSIAPPEFVPSNYGKLAMEKFYFAIGGSINTLAAKRPAPGPAGGSPGLGGDSSAGPGAGLGSTGSGSPGSAAVLGFSDYLRRFMMDAFLPALFSRAETISLEIFQEVNRLFEYNAGAGPAEVHAGALPAGSLAALSAESPVPEVCPQPSGPPVLRSAARLLAILAELAFVSSRSERLGLPAECRDSIVQLAVALVKKYYTLGQNILSRASNNLLVSGIEQASYDILPSDLQPSADRLEHLFKNICVNDFLTADQLCRRDFDEDRARMRSIRKTEQPDYRNKPAQHADFGRSHIGSGPTYYSPGAVSPFSAYDDGSTVLSEAALKFELSPARMETLAIISHSMNWLYSRISLLRFGGGDAAAATASRGSKGPAATIAADAFALSHQQSLGTHVVDGAVKLFISLSTNFIPGIPQGDAVANTIQPSLPLNRSDLAGLYFVPHTNSTYETSFTALLNNLHSLAKRFLFVVRSSILRMACVYASRGIRRGDYTPHRGVRHGVEADVNIRTICSALQGTFALLQPTLARPALRFVFYGLPMCIAESLIDSSQYIHYINRQGVLRLTLNVFYIQQHLGAIFAEVPVPAGTGRVVAAADPMAGGASPAFGEHPSLARALALFQLLYLDANSVIALVASAASRRRGGLGSAAAGHGSPCSSLVSTPNLLGSRSPGVRDMASMLMDPSDEGSSSGAASGAGPSIGLLGVDPAGTGAGSMSLLSDVGLGLFDFDLYHYRIVVDLIYRNFHLLQPDLATSLPRLLATESAAGATTPPVDTALLSARPTYDEQMQTLERAFSGMPTIASP